MLEMSMSLSYVPDTLMKQLELFLLSVEVEIPLLSLEVAEYNGLAMRYVRNTRPLLPKKERSRSILASNKTAQVVRQVEPGQPKDHQIILKKKGHTHPPDQEEGSQMYPGKRFLGSSLKLQVFLLHKVIM